MIPMSPGVYGLPRGGRAAQLRQFTLSKVPADRDGMPAQHAGIDPTVSASSYPNIPASWVYTPLLGRRSAGISFFHQANPNRTLVQFGQHEIYNFTGGVYFPEPCQFERVVCKDVDFNSGQNQYSVKIAGKEGIIGGESPCWIQIVGRVPADNASGLPSIDWYEMFNLRSRTSLVILPQDPRYNLDESMGPQGFEGRPFSTATAFVVNNRIQEMELEDFTWSSTDQMTRRERERVARILWTACKEDMRIRTAATVRKMDQIHEMAYSVLGGSGRADLMPRRVDINDSPM